MRMTLYSCETFLRTDCWGKTSIISRQSAKPSTGPCSQLLMDPARIPPDTFHCVAVLRQSRTVSAQWALHYESRPRFADTDWGEAPPQKESMPALAHAVDVGGVILEGSRAVLEWASTKICSGFEEKHATRKGNQLPAAMMIGAYGGDHIGDAAILGGVLLRFKARHGTRRALSDESAS